MTSITANVRNSQRTIIADPADRTAELLDAALLYASRGYRVVPCFEIRNGVCSCDNKPGKKCSPGKHPRIKEWTTRTTTDEAMIREWWRIWPTANLGIATGRGVGMVDIDPRHGGDASLSRLETELGPLPKECVERSGGGGLHIYLSFPAGVKIKTTDNILPGVDVRGDGGLVIVAPSNHISGGQNVWLSPLSHNPPLAPIRWHGLLTDQGRERDRIDISSSSSSYSVLEHPSPTPANGAKPWSSDTQKRVEAAIFRLRLTRPGTRNKKMLALVQSISKIPELQSRLAADLEHLIRKWFDLSAKHTESFWPEVWGHWVYLWTDWVDHNYDDLAYQAYAAAMAKPFPDATQQYNDPDMQRLIALCCELEQRSRLKVWYLSCRKAADVPGISKNMANGFLKQLVTDKVLEFTDEHVAGSTRAQRYRYAADEATSLSRAA
jgi:hypothetical protein